MLTEPSSTELIWRSSLVVYLSVKATSVGILEDFYTKTLRRIIMAKMATAEMQVKLMRTVLLLALLLLVLLLVLLSPILVRDIHLHQEFVYMVVLVLITKQLLILILSLVN